MNSYKVHFYRTAAGKYPFFKWSRKLKDTKAKALIETRINGLKEGHFGDIKFLEDEIFELRIHCGPGYRVYLAFEKDHIIVLLFGGQKGTQKHDIKKAKIYWQDYKIRSSSTWHEP